MSLGSSISRVHDFSCQDLVTRHPSIRSSKTIDQSLYGLVRLHQVLVFLIISESGCWCLMFWEFWYLVASIYYWYWTCWSRLSEAIVENCFCCMEPGVRRLRRTALNKRRSTRWSLLAIVGEAPVGNWLRTRWQSVLAYVGIPCMWASVCKVWYCSKQNNLHPFWRRLL